MLYQNKGFGSLSKTNISNCISSQKPGFEYDYVESTVNVSFCNFENLQVTDGIITYFYNSPGRIDRCNYKNNSQNDEYFGIVSVTSKRLDIFDSSFQNNPEINKGKLFEAGNGDGKIYIHRCSIDSYSADTGSGIVYTSDQGTESFKNNLTFLGLRPCEGNLGLVLLFIPKKENIICSLSPCVNFLFGEYHLSILLLNKQ
ncbi:hypothetical protein TVAG_251460 [Trichomonas vaginalis G3]|uniref:Right handed beta helix domain-containing protein n=1 Tax=Trichomonas vaginalis (strain ATCC PRA-98 / G3) TaxID=412133 RepID=A2EF04_TRIV3|nr:hypothetical protein TVAGG3_0740070 [Trichomonas vaginalis G3]EAY08720.1 hypothetical protein TVAG_251460 [Trichomonas vaginalis G3]KAI5511820.1 hypothetical protein TVAGG3_0740070 [Trichomonas vaginalis G3]|eukprot:XP_001320943.1 hypothetical protein [Trichomonas vaginalis G3]